MARVVVTHQRHHFLDTEKGALEQHARAAQPYALDVFGGSETDLRFKEVAEARRGEVDELRDLRDGERLGEVPLNVGHRPGDAPVDHRPVHTPGDYKPRANMLGRAS